MSGRTLSVIYNSLVLDQKNGSFVELAGNSRFSKGDRMSISPGVDKMQWWNDYCQELSDTQDNGDGSSSSEGSSLQFTLGEVVEDHCPFVLEFTFAVVDSPYSSNPQFWGNMAESLVKVAQTVILDRYDTHQHTLKCLVVDSGEPWEQGGKMWYKSRLHFPFLDIPLHEQKELQHKATGLLEESSSIRETLNGRVSNRWAEIVSSSLKDNVLPLYGSSSDEEPALFVYGFYDKITETSSTLDLALLHPETARHLEGESRHHSDIDPEVNDYSERSDPVFWLPIILSSRYEMIKPARKGEEKKRAQARPAVELGSKVPRPTIRSTKTEVIKYLLSNIALETWKKRSNWRSILIAMKHEYKASRKGLELAKQYSAHNGVFSAQECEYWYAKSHPNVRETIGTLKWFAEKDTPEEIQAWREEEFTEKLEKLLDSRYVEQDHVAVAELFTTLYPYEFAVKLEGGKSWFFHNHRWHEQDGYIAIKERMSKGFRDKISACVDHYNERSGEARRNMDKVLEDKYTGYSALCRNLYQKLGTDGYRRSFLNLLKENIKTIYPDFESLCNRNIELYACGNGVLHSILADKSVIFRDGKPEDHLTNGTDTDYRPDFTINSPMVQEYCNYYEMVFPDPGTRHVVKKLDAKELLGRNHDKKFVWQLGPTGSSKSTKSSIDSKVHGAYFGNVSDDYFLSSGPGADKPSSQLAKVVDCRKIQLDETTGTSSYSSAKIKRYTGNDPFFSRKMRDDGSFRIPQGIPYFTGNVPPIFDSPEPAMYERGMFIKYVSQFFDEGDPRIPETEEERKEKCIFPRSIEFENNIADLAEAGLWYRVYYFPIYAEERFTVLPEQMKRARDEYWNENDPYAHYKQSELTEDDIGYIDGKELFLDYIRWFATFYSQLPPPGWPTFKRSMIMALGEMDGLGWPGYCLRRANAAMGDAEFGNQ